MAMIQQSQSLGRLKPGCLSGCLSALYFGGPPTFLARACSASLFSNLHLLILPAAMGAFIVGLRNSRKKVGVYDPKIVAQNKKGRV